MEVIGNRRPWEHVGDVGQDLRSRSVDTLSPSVVFLFKKFNYLWLKFKKLRIF